MNREGEVGFLRKVTQNGNDKGEGDTTGGIDGTYRLGPSAHAVSRAR